MTRKTKKRGTRAPNKLQNTRTRLEIEGNRAIIAELTLKGWSQYEIAEHLEISQSLVSLELKAIRDRWRQEASESMDLIKQEEIKAARKVQREYWEAWEKSKEPRIIVKQESGTGSQGEWTKESIQTEERSGDPRYLDGVLKSKQQLQQLLGLTAEIHYEDINRAIAAVVAAGYDVLSNGEYVLPAKDTTPKDSEEDPAEEPTAQS